MEYPKDFINKIICSDCLEVMKKMPDNCVDTIITDPPYGLEFMGKDWDKLKRFDSRDKKAKSASMNRENAPIGTSPTYVGGHEAQLWHFNWATEALHVAKPGATLLCFGGTRTYHRLACAIEDAGWILKDCIMWLYGSGFPKASDISKQIDKNILRIDLFKPFAKHFKAQRLKKNLTHKDIAKHFLSKTGGLTGCVWNWENAENVPTVKQWNILKPLLDLSDRFLPLIKRIEAEREIIGKHPNPAGSKGNTFPLNQECDITTPATPEATLWDGWKSHGLKPAYEPILVAVKPNEGSYANNALKWGVAGLNIDSARIKFQGKEDYDETTQKNRHADFNSNNGVRVPTKGIYHGDNRSPENYNPDITKGRYPANVILDEEVGRLLDEQSGTLKSGKNKSKFLDMKNQWLGRSYYPEELNYGDSGGASRFFYCAKASKTERNKGCGGLSDKLITTHKGKYRKCKKCGKRAMSGTKEQIQYRCQCENPDWEIVETDSKIYITKNNHPTVKPLALMKYLCTLTKTPTGGIVFDPFCGSGTTLMACKELKRDYIGIDNNPEYCEIAKRRVKAIPESLF